MVDPLTHLVWLIWTRAPQRAVLRRRHCSVERLGVPGADSHSGDLIVLQYLPNLV